MGNQMRPNGPGRGARTGDVVFPLAWIMDNEARGPVLEIADDLVYEMTQRGRLHGPYGPRITWTQRSPGECRALSGRSAVAAVRPSIAHLSVIAQLHFVETDRMSHHKPCAW